MLICRHNVVVSYSKIDSIAQFHKHARHTTRVYMPYGSFVFSELGDRRVKIIVLQKNKIIKKHIIFFSTSSLRSRAVRDDNNDYIVIEVLYVFVCAYIFLYIHYVFARTK